MIPKHSKTFRVNRRRTSLAASAAILLGCAQESSLYAQIQPNTVEKRKQSASSKLLDASESNQLIEVKPPSTGATTDAARQPADAPEIVVTGSHIRGAAPTGSPMNIIDRSEIDHSGLGTAAQVLHMLPQNFRGGINEEVREGPDYGTNAFDGSVVNLRGLGANSTLTLLNGRRVPGGGLKGGFTDISMIPLSAIERMEILPDGASAIYGSDAVAGVVNIVLKKNYDEIESRVRYGTVTQGSLHDIQLSQSIGRDWGLGSLIVNYEYHHRDALPASEVSRTRTADMRRFGGGDHRFIYSNPGNILNPDTYMPEYGIPRNQNGISLAVENLVPGTFNLGEPNQGSDLTAKQDRHSAYAHINQNFFENLKMSTEVMYSTRHFLSRLPPSVTILEVPSSNPFIVDPFGAGYTLVSYNFENEQKRRNSGRVTDILGMITADYQLVSWEIRATAAYGREKSRSNAHELIDFDKLNSALANPNPQAAFNPFADGPGLPAEVMKDYIFSQLTKRKSQIWNANLIADGPMLALPAGELKMAAGLDFRRETLSGTSEFNADLSTIDTNRNIYASFAELSIPIIEEAMNITLVRTLDLSLAVRYDKYESIGDTVNPKVGAKLGVIEGLSLRSSYGTAFRAPNLLDTDDSFPTMAITIFPDPRSPSGNSQVLYLAGSNPNLSNEKSRTWTVGFDWQPIIFNRLIINMTYFDISFKDRISSPPISTALLGQEDQFPNSILRNPTSAELAPFCSHVRLEGNREQCREGRIAAIVDLRLQNMSRMNVRGIDFGASGSFPAIGGNATAGLNASYLIDFHQRQTDSTPASELLNTLGNPNKFRLRGSFIWSVGGVTASTFITYQDSYINNRKEIFDRIDNSFFADVQLAYRHIGTEKDLFRNTEISLSLQNIFNTKPPFVDWEIGYDPANASAISRFFAIEFRKQW